MTYCHILKCIIICLLFIKKEALECDIVLCCIVNKLKFCRSKFQCNCSQRVHSIGKLLHVTKYMYPGWNFNVKIHLYTLDTCGMSQHDKLQIALIKIREAVCTGSTLCVFYSEKKISKNSGCLIFSIMLFMLSTHQMCAPLLSLICLLLINV